MQVKAFRTAIENTLEQQGVAKDGPTSPENFLHALRYDTVLLAFVLFALCACWVCTRSLSVYKRARARARACVASCFLYNLVALDSLTCSEMENIVQPPKKGIGKKIFGLLMKYIMWWIKTSAWLGGASEAKEYGTMPKTDN